MRRVVVNPSNTGPAIESPTRHPLRVGLIGFGRTGRSVATLILEHPDVRLEWVVRRSDRLEHRCAGNVLGIDADDPGVIHSSAEITADELLSMHPVDAIIDFSSESGVDYYGDAAASRSISIVCAISQWHREVDGVFDDWARRTRVLWSPNITIGINFMLLAAQTLRAISPCCDVEIVEEHFKAKREVSGTAVRLAMGLGVNPESIKTIRAGGIIGTHEILFGFPFQTVRLRHESISREAFADGAIFAAQHLVGLPNGRYRMEDLLAPYFARAHDTSGDQRERATERR